MILVWLIGVLILGGILAWFVAPQNALWARWISILAIAIDLVLTIVFWSHHFGQGGITGGGQWLEEVSWPWIPQFGIGFHLAVDGFSLLMLLLTFFIGLVGVVASWTEIEERVGFFHFNLLWVLAGVVGVFLALDLFLFYFFWEMMLIPMYFLIAIWGHENRTYAAIKFFIFTQASSLLMLVAILALVLIHGRAAGTYTFDYTQLLRTGLSAHTGMLLMLGFFVAFAVKLPAFPVHTWLPDAHTEAPTAGSIILAALMLKTGAYGMIRFVVPLFPDAAHRFAPVAMLIAVIGIIYGAILAFGQTDLKRLIAYTSVSHLGFVLLAIFTWNQLALQGAVMEMICHGLSTGGLFFMVGALSERIHSRDYRRMGGLWETMPRMAGVALVLAMASLGLPGLGNFVAEFLILLGAYQVTLVLTVIATVGLIFAMIYSLAIMARAFYGPNQHNWKLHDLHVHEWVGLGAMLIVLVWLGIYPQPVLRTADSALQNIQHYASAMNGGMASK
jgi:NADH-quinone oxidoreductase subunit M